MGGTHASPCPSFPAPHLLLLLVGIDGRGLLSCFILLLAPLL